MDLFMIIIFPSNLSSSISYVILSPLTAAFSSTLQEMYLIWCGVKYTSSPFLINWFNIPVLWVKICCHTLTGLTADSLLLNLHCSTYCKCHMKKKLQWPIYSSVFISCTCSDWLLSAAVMFGQSLVKYHIPYT